MFCLLLLLAIGKLEIYHFTDRTVAVWDNDDKIRIVIQSKTEVASISTDNETKFYGLSGSDVFHKIDCRYVVDKPMVLTFTPEQCLLKKPCFFCKPEVLR